MAEETGDSSALTESAMDGVRAVYQHVSVVLASEPDPHAAFALATQFADFLRVLADEAAELRAAAVGRIWDSEATSLSGLAQKIGVSKARAAQLMQTARSINTPDQTKNEGDA